MFDLFGRKKAQAVLTRMREDEEWHNSLVAILTQLDNNVQALKEAQLALVKIIEGQEERLGSLEFFMDGVLAQFEDVLKDLDGMAQRTASALSDLLSVPVEDLPRTDKRDANRPEIFPEGVM